LNSLKIRPFLGSLLQANVQLRIGRLSSRIIGVRISEESFDEDVTTSRDVVTLSLQIRMLVTVLEYLIVSYRLALFLFAKVHTAIIIVISKLLKRYSKAKRTRASAYSRALRRIKGGFSNEGSREAQVRFPE